MKILFQKKKKGGGKDKKNWAFSFLKVADYGAMRGTKKVSNLLGS